MAAILSSEIESVFRFTVNTKTLKKSNSVCTPEFKLSDSKWKVRFSRKKNDGGEKCLAIYVECVSLKKTSILSEDRKKEWSREVQATFTLLQPDGHADKSIVKCLPTTIFKRKNLSHGVDDFIKWDEFLKNCVHDNLAIFEINISTSPLKPKRNTINKMIPISAKLLVVIKEVNKLSRISSSEIVVQGIRWKILIKKEGEHLGVFLHCEQNDMDVNWNYKVDAKFTLLTSNLHSKSLIRNFSHKYAKGELGWGYENFIKWSDLVDKTKGYVNDNRANLNVEIKVEDPEPTWKLERPTPLKTSSSFECIAVPS